MAHERTRYERGASIEPGLVIAGGALLAAFLLNDEDRRAQIKEIATKSLDSAIAMAKTNLAPSSSPIEMSAEDLAFREKIERAKRPVRAAAPSTTSAPTIENEPKPATFATSAPTIERAPKASTLNTTARFVARAAPSIAPALSTCEMLTSAPRICEESATRVYARGCGRAISAPTTRKARASRAAPFVALGVARGETRARALVVAKAAPFAALRVATVEPRARAPTLGRAAPTSTPAPPPAFGAYVLVSTSGADCAANPGIKSADDTRTPCAPNVGPREGCNSSSTTAPGETYFS